MSKKKLQQRSNDPKFVYSIVLAVLAAFFVLLIVRDEITRFILIVPIFAGWILFNIFILTEEDL